MYFFEEFGSEASSRVEAVFQEMNENGKHHQLKTEAGLQSDVNSAACGEMSLAVLAVQQIRRMRGGAQGQIMLGADGQ